MSSIGHGKLKCITPKCGRVRPYWADYCAKCRRTEESAKVAAVRTFLEVGYSGLTAEEKALLT